MINLNSDYINGACDEILNRLLQVKEESFFGYGEDMISKQAKQKIRDACQCQEAEVAFLVGGTQTNSTVISTMLQDYEGVISVDTGHINVHEAGAVEYTGHKVIALPGKEGKLSSTTLEAYLKRFWNDDTREHMVFPGMVYISYPTELGTLYSAEEIELIYETCCKYDVKLFVDGARLGYGLMSEQSDVTLPFLAKHCDVFYIGGTKVGALFGEAVVFPKKNMPKYFMTMVKQHGAMLAKGWLLGLQFDTLFTDDLYFEISRHAIKMAERLKEIFIQKGYDLYIDSPTNQQFILVEDHLLSELRKELIFEVWEKPDKDHTAIRLVTGWGTKEEDIERIESIIPKYK